MHSKVVLLPDGPLGDVLLAVHDDNEANFHQLVPLGRFDLVVAMSVCLCVCLMSLFMRYILRPILAPLSEVGCPKFLEIRNLWGKVLERRGLRIEHFFCYVV